jgi:cytochrome c556
LHLPAQMLRCGKSVFGGREMKSSRLIVVLGLALGAAGLGAAPGLAQGMGTVPEQRAALMKQQAGDLGTIHGYLDDQAPKAKAIAAATDLTETTRKIPSVFPEGSGGTSPDGKFTTKPEIWSDWKGFLAAQNNAVQKSFALEAAVKTGDKKKIGAAFADLGKNGCGGCHGKFREQATK